MKKILLLALISALSFSTFAADPTVSPADAKWLAAIEKMVASGHYEISTPSATRADLLKDWAKKNGCAFEVSKTDTCIRIKLTKDLANN